MESSLKNMVLSLLSVTVVASASVGYVYQLTAAPIAAAKEQATQSALKMVLPEFDANVISDLMIDDLQTVVYTASKSNEVIGYAVKSISNQGYAGAITLMVGIAPNGDLLDVSVLSQNETPGLGSKMKDADNSLIKSVKGRNISKLDLRVKKDGGDIDALTGATISSRAYGDAIARAYKAVDQVKLAKKGANNE
ncbi:MAG: RnfABCDGE type electron transport complex subunit G [Rikenellaceae bacterium]